MTSSNYALTSPVQLACMICASQLTSATQIYDTLKEYRYPDIREDAVYHAVSLMKQDKLVTTSKDPEEHRRVCVVLNAQGRKLLKKRLKTLGVVGALVADYVG